MEETPIQQFYKDANVFITGGTGFMGKILVEKLLRSTDVATLYLLVRNKKNKSSEDRINSLFEDVIFNKLKEVKPNSQYKVKGVGGDLSETNLGLNIADRELLISKINIVIHLGATVKFNEHLKTALTTNVYGTKYILNLAKEMTNLKSLVYISTAYSNSPRKKIDEKIYDSPIRYEDFIFKVEKMSDKELEEATPSIIGKWPNTYVFTKCIAESLVKELAGDVPVAIFRPSIVVSTYKEPVEGWKNTLYGPTGVYMAILSGLMKVYYGDPSIVLDVIPVDMCIAAIISCAWDVSIKRNKLNSDISVYNYVSGAENPVTLGEITQLNVFYSDIFPTVHAFWKVGVIFEPNPYKYWFLSAVFHIIPASILDLFAVCTGNKPKLLNLYKKIHMGCEALTFFSFREWEFSNNNIRSVWQKMNQTDKDLFPFSIANVNWMNYFKLYILGLRKYILKDPDSTLSEAKRKNAWFSTLNQIGKYIIVFGIMKTIFKLLSLLQLRQLLKIASYRCLKI